MFQVMKNAWKVKEIRQKILYTVLILIIFRLGCAIMAPFVDTAALSTWVAENSEGNIISYMNMLSGGALSRATIFSLSISPYINAQIIIQLLTYALPPLERLSKEGEEGRKKINLISTVLALVIAVFTSFAYYLTMKNTMRTADGKSVLEYTNGGFEEIFSMICIMFIFVAGASLIIWLGGLIDEKGIGNGISMILLAGIISRYPVTIYNLIKLMISEETRADYVFAVPLVFVLYIAIIVFIVFMNNAERRIPIQYAKRVIGRKQYGGQNTHIPIKVCMSGVLPIIFAMSFMQLPSTIELFVPRYDYPNGFGQKFYNGFLDFFNSQSIGYAILYFLLIIGFNYFYVSMQYNPTEIANNLRQNNGGIPGIRPGKPTSDFIQRVLSKITLFGAFFLGIIAVFPILFSKLMTDAFGLAQLSTISMGGTSILIVVSVALETTRTLESQMMMRHHKGFLE